jgi:hypothetical protein
MTDPIKITDPNHVPSVFVSALVGNGFLNGVVNLTFATALYTPLDGAIDPDYVITSRLRMDLYAAQQLYAALGGIIEANTKPNGVKEH